MIKLRSGTDCGFHVVFDPLALKGHKAGTAWEKFRELALSGDLIVYDTHGDGSDEIWVYLEEEPPAEVLKDAVLVKRGGLLRVPSGTLWAAGQEFAEGVHDQPAAKNWKVPIEHMGSRMELPNGDYRVNAYLQKSEDYDEALADRTDAVLTPEQKKEVERSDTFWTYGCLATILLGIAAIVLLSFDKSVWVNLIALAIAGIWIVYCRKKDSATEALIEKVRKEYEATIFGALLVLRKADGPIDAADGVILDLDLVDGGEDQIRRN